MFDRFLQRLLSLTAIADADSVSLKLPAFAFILFIHLAARDGIRFVEYEPYWRLGLAMVFLACAIGVLIPRFRSASIYICLALMSFKLLLVFPQNSNHFLIEFLCVAFLAAGCGRRLDTGDGLVVMAQALRGLPIIVLLWSGLKKMMHGTYFDGSFLAFVIEQPGFSWFFESFLPGEYARVSQISPPGPYGFDSILPVVLSNAIYFGEIFAAVLLLTPRFRTVGVWGAGAVVLGIEIVARELLFGALFCNLLLLYAPAQWHRRSRIAFVAFYLLLIGSKAGLLPGFYFN